MPKVKYNGSKGLYQVAGQGIDLNGQVTLGHPSGSATLAQGNQPQLNVLCFMHTASAASTVAEHNLTAPDGSEMMIPKDFLVVEGWFEVLQAYTSGGSATITLGTKGTSNDPDGLLISKAKAVLTAAATFGCDGALVSGSSHHGDRIHKRFVTTSEPVSITIGTAALTAGKGYLYLLGFQSPGAV